MNKAISFLAVAIALGAMAYFKVDSLVMIITAVIGFIAVSES